MKDAMVGNLSPPTVRKQTAWGQSTGVSGESGGVPERVFPETYPGKGAYSNANACRGSAQSSW